MQTMCPLLVYILAISLQLAGAELLIVNYWRLPLKQLIEIELNKQPHVGEEETILYTGGESELEISRNILLNRFAFVFIALGYLFGVFGDMQDYCRWFIAFWVLVISVMITLSTNYVVGKMIKSMLDKNGNP